MTMHNQRSTPITQSDPHRDVLPHAYVVLRRTQLCRSCGTLHEYSEIYSHTYLRSQLGAGKHVDNLRRLFDGQPRYNLPVRLQDRALEEIPFCHECYDTISLSHLPNVPPPESSPSTALRGMDVVRNTPFREGDPEPAASPRARPPRERKPEMGLDEILNFEPRK